MQPMPTPDPNRMHDIRTVNRHLRAGRTSKEMFEAFLSALPDAQENIKDPQDGGDPDGFDDMDDASSMSSNPSGSPPSWGSLMFSWASGRADKKASNISLEVRPARRWRFTVRMSCIRFGSGVGMGCKV